MYVWNELKQKKEVEKDKETKQTAEKKEEIKQKKVVPENNHTKTKKNCFNEKLRKNVTVNSHVFSKNKSLN